MSEKADKKVMNKPPSDKDNQALSGEQLKEILSLGKGILIGSSTVVSYKVLEEVPGHPGVICIKMDQDAGRTYLEEKEENKYIHIYLLHNPAEINFHHLAKDLQELLTELMKEQLSPEELTLFWQTMYLWSGEIDDPKLNMYKKTHLPQKLIDHLQIVTNLPKEYHYLLNNVVCETVEALNYQGVKLRPVTQVICIHKKR